MTDVRTTFLLLVLLASCDGSSAMGEDGGSSIDGGAYDAGHAAPDASSIVDGGLDAAVSRDAGPAPARVDPSRFTVYFDPSDPARYGPERPACQLIVAGNRFNTGRACDNVNAGAGYGLCFDDANEIHSFAMEDGETLRFGARDVTGLCGQPRALVNHHQWRNDGSYDEAQERNGVNLSTSYPGIDRTYFDGTRSQLACIPNGPDDPLALSASFGGRTCDPVLQTATFRVERWMLAADLNAAGGGIHEPGVGAPSPWTQFLGEAELRVITRDSTAPFTGASVPGTVRAAAPITEADVGAWWTTIYDYCIDPIDGYFRVWLRRGAGASFEPLVQIEDGWGYAFAAGDANNDRFYTTHVHFYSWHRYTNDAARAPNNWDATYGAVRTMAYAYSGAIIGPTDLTVADLMDHARAIACD